MNRKVQVGRKKHDEQESASRSLHYYFKESIILKNILTSEIIMLQEYKKCFLLSTMRYILDNYSVVNYSLSLERVYRICERFYKFFVNVLL